LTYNEYSDILGRASFARDKTARIKDIFFMQHASLRISRPWWTYAGRLLIVIVGLFIFAVGDVLTYRANVGLGPWDVLHQGISFHTPLSFGTAGIVVGAVLIV